MGLNGTKANREIASTPSEHAVTGWDDMIPLSCNPIKVDSGQNSSDHFGSDSGHEALSATTSTCAISPGVRSSNEGQMKITVTGGKEAGALVTAALNPQERRDSSWLDIDHFFNSSLEAEDSAAEGKCQEMGKIEDKPRPNAEDGPGDRDIVKHSGEGTIADPEMEGLEVDREGFKIRTVTGLALASIGKNPSDAQAPQAPQALIASSPPVARRGRGRPRRSRPAIVVGNTTWEVTKVAGDEQSGEGPVFKVQAEAWLAEKDVSSLRNAIATLGTST
ncbi:MAG: hypothetical protein LQ350_008634 [Teloschistes chrysophthalmus]|nr:MAG: hypothetical protein LQ350_008634 [Niorma chrysophthalma]